MPVIWDREVRQIYCKIGPDELHNYPNMVVDYGAIKTSTHSLAEYGWSLIAYQRTPLHVAKTRPYIAMVPGDNRNLGFRWKCRARAPWNSVIDVFNDLATLGKPQKFNLTGYETKFIPDGRDKMRIEELERQVAKLKEMNTTASSNNARLQDVVDELSVKLRVARPMLSGGARPPIQTGPSAQMIKASPTDFVPVQQEKPSTLAIVNASGEFIYKPGATRFTAYEPPNPFPALEAWNEKNVGRFDWTEDAHHAELVEEVEHPRPEPEDNIVDLVELLKQRTPIEMNPELDERLRSFIG